MDEYIKKAMSLAAYETMENGKIFASIPKVPGAWAVGSSNTIARMNLREVLVGWIYVHTEIGKAPLPELE